MAWRRFAGSLNGQASFANEPYKYRTPFRKEPDVSRVEKLRCRSQMFDVIHSCVQRRIYMRAMTYSNATHVI